MAITTVILGATMAAMNDAIKATESAQLVTGLNNGLRTAMDLMVRDMLQVGQGLPSGRVILVPSGDGLDADAAAGSGGVEPSAGWSFVLSSRHVCLRADLGGHPWTEAAGPRSSRDSRPT